MQDTVIHELNKEGKSCFPKLTREGFFQLHFLFPEFQSITFAQILINHLLRFRLAFVIIREKVYEY